MERLRVIQKNELIHITNFYTQDYMIANFY